MTTGGEMEPGPMAFTTRVPHARGGPQRRCGQREFIEPRTPGPAPGQVRRTRLELGECRWHARDQYGITFGLLLVSAAWIRNSSRTAAVSPPLVDAACLRAVITQPTASRHREFNCNGRCYTYIE